MIQNNNTEGTQPNKPVTPQKPKRGRNFLFNTLGVLILLAITVFSGYRAGINVRQQTEKETLLQKLGEQYQNALVDIQFERYEIAKQRLEWIIQKDSGFPGAQQTLTDVLVKINQQENYVAPTATPSQVPTPDFSGIEDAFTKAKQYIDAKDWASALSALDEVRKLDSNYQTSQVDGMYYFALRNRGYDLITQQGNLEGGIYYLTLAERFGQLDNNANGIREGARYYILGASFWELDWKQTLYYFNQVYGGWSSLWDGTMTASERFRVASMRYGDELYADDQYCDAVAQYDNAMAIAPLDKISDPNYNKAYVGCHPPTPTIDPNSLITPTVEVIVTEPPATEPPATEPPATP